MGDFFKRDWKRLLTSNSTAASYASRVAKTTAPAISDVGLIKVAGFTDLLLAPFGANADNLTMKIRVLGWRRVADLWVPCVLAELTATLSQAVGVSGESVSESERFADTITVDKGIGLSIDNASDLPAFAQVSVEGFEFVEVLFNRNSSATACNSLYSLQ